MILSPVPTDGLALAWPTVAPWLKRVCERPESDLSLPWLRDLCAAGQALLVTIQDRSGAPIAAGVSQVRDHADGTRSCWILAMGGAGARSWAGTLALIEAGAAAKGCDRIEFVGRAGWSRLLPDYRASRCERGTHYLKTLRA